MNLSERIKKIRQTFGVTQEHLANVLGTSIGVPKGWEQGNTKKIKEKYSIKLANKFGINKDWIENGTGEMRINQYKNMLKDTAIISDVLNEYGKRIPYYEDIKASAGTGYVNEEFKTSYIQLADDILPSKSKKIEAIRVHGDSMSGTISDGDIIFIDKNATTPANGKIYVVYLCDEVYVKRLFKDPNTKKLILKSDNPVYPQFEATCEDFKIIGQVIASMNIKEL